MALGISDLEKRMDWIKANPAPDGKFGYAYVETGRCKPYGASVPAAASRRGYKVEKKQAGVYYVFPKK